MSRTSKVALIVLVGLVVLGGLLQTPLLRGVRGTLWSALVVVVGFWGQVGPLAPDPAYTDQLATLQSENVRLRAELRDYVQLREQLRQPAIASLRPIEAVVSGAPLDIFRSHFLINRGALDGVVIGAPVVVYGSTLVGFVSELNEHSAVCRLLFHPDISLPAEVVDAEHARGLLVGTLYTSLTLTTVPRDAQITEGQAVVTVAQDITPAGLVIGEIEKVFRQENEAYQEARLRVPYDPDDVRAVTVLVQP